MKNYFRDKSRRLFVYSLLFVLIRNSVGFIWNFPLVNAENNQLCLPYANIVIDAMGVEDSDTALCMPDNDSATVGLVPNSTLILDMGVGNEIRNTDGVDLYFYEYLNNDIVFLDQIEISIAKFDVEDEYIKIFVWGDGNPNNNGLISVEVPEIPNQEIPATFLHNNYGIKIDINDAVNNENTNLYRFVRIRTFPRNAVPAPDERAEIDAIERKQEIIPHPTATVTATVATATAVPTSTPIADPTATTTATADPTATATVATATAVPTSTPIADPTATTTATADPTATATVATATAVPTSTPIADPTATTTATADPTATATVATATAVPTSTPIADLTATTTATADPTATATVATATAVPTSTPIADPTATTTATADPTATATVATATAVPTSTPIADLTATTTATADPTATATVATATAVPTSTPIADPTATTTATADPTATATVATATAGMCQ